MVLASQDVMVTLVRLVNLKPLDRSQCRMDIPSHVNESVELSTCTQALARGEQNGTCHGARSIAASRQVLCTAIGLMPLGALRRPFLAKSGISLSSKPQNGGARLPS